MCPRPGLWLEVALEEQFAGLAPVGKLTLGPSSRGVMLGKTRLYWDIGRQGRTGNPTAVDERCRLAAAGQLTQLALGVVRVGPLPRPPIHTASEDSVQVDKEIPCLHRPSVLVGPLTFVGEHFFLLEVQANVFVPLMLDLTRPLRIGEPTLGRGTSGSGENEVISSVLLPRGGIVNAVGAGDLHVHG